MRKVVLAVLSNILMVVLPLLGKPALMLHPKILIIIAGSVAMWLTQPAFTVQETSEKKSSDQSSIIIILAMSLISVVAPVVHWGYFMKDQDPFTYISWLGVGMIITGIVFRALAVQYLGKYFTPTVQIREDHQLITTGPYSIVRHPSYTGAYLAIVAGGVVLGSLPGFILSCIAMTAAYIVRIGVEEKELTARFGDAYLQYKRRTKMIIPYVW
jgi:protein-S-isoprenylcysteine O-methyltransferase Ste14